MNLEPALSSLLAWSLANPLVSFAIVVGVMALLGSASASAPRAAVAPLRAVYGLTLPVRLLLLAVVLIVLLWWWRNRDARETGHKPSWREQLADIYGR